MKKKVTLLLLLCVISLCIYIFYFINTIQNKEFSKIMNGDFESICDLDTEQIYELKKVYKNYTNNSEWLYIDVNKDGREELLWGEKKGEIVSLFAIFSMTQNGCERILWDAADSDNIYFILDDKITYYSRYSGIYEDYCFWAIKIDSEGNLKYEEGYEVLKITDIEEAGEIWEDCEEGTYYVKMTIANEKLQKEEMSYKEWITDFENSIGEFDYEKMLQ